MLTTNAYKKLEECAIRTLIKNRFENFKLIKFRKGLLLKTYEDVYNNKNDIISYLENKYEYLYYDALTCSELFYTHYTERTNTNKINAEKNSYYKPYFDEIFNDTFGLCVFEYCVLFDELLSVDPYYNECCWE